MVAAVTVDIFGGLGNQLFQFAAGLALARRTDSDVLLKPIPTRRPLLLDRFAIDLRFAPRGPLPRRVANYLAWRLGTTPPGAFRERDFTFDRRFLDLRPPVRIQGYFQSELYFSGVADEVRRLATLKNGLSPQGADLSARIRRAPLSASIHVRRGDFLAGADPRFYALGVDYYRRATALMASVLGGEPTYFIFSDDPEWAASALDFLPDRVTATVGYDRPEEDLILMAECRHHIIANSTFSWWGAWLNRHPDKTVIAPRQWYTPASQRRYNITDLHPPGWILI
jgi:hypothetical protein